MNLTQVIVRPVQHAEESHFQKLMGAYHYLGALPKIGNTIWYIAIWKDEWVALISFSAAALKCERVIVDLVGSIATSTIGFIFLPTIHDS